MVASWVLWLFGGLLLISMAVNCWQYCECCPANDCALCRLQVARLERDRLVYCIREARRMLALAAANLNLADPDPPADEEEENP